MPIGPVNFSNPRSWPNLRGCADSHHSVELQVRGLVPATSGQKNRLSFHWDGGRGPGLVRELDLAASGWIVSEWRVIRPEREQAARQIGCNFPERVWGRLPWSRRPSHPYPSST